MIPLYWHRSANFGDALSPWLVGKISGEPPVYVEPREDTRPFIVTGSIFGYNVKSAVVWGAGCAWGHHLDPEKLAPPGALRVLATRGRLSRDLVREAGHNPKTYCDPGFLVPRFHKPRVDQTVDVALMCSWVDEQDVLQRFPDIPFINSRAPITDVIDRICSTRLLLSSSLHGLVVGAAYGIPVAWVSFSNRMVGDGFKYRDVGFTKNNWVRTMEDIARVSPEKIDLPDTDAMMACCPFN